MENSPSGSPSLLSRRALLLGGASVAASSALTVAGFRHRMSRIRADFARSGDAIDALPEPTVESLNPGEVVPEFRRTGEEMLICFPYDDRLFPEQDLARVIESQFGPMLQALPRYTTLHLIGPDHFPKDAVTRLGGLPVHFYPCFNAGTAGMYVQDVGDALGTLTPEGQFRLVGPLASREWLHTKEACGHSFEDPRGWTVPGTDIWEPNPLYMDDVLAEKYPNQFRLQLVNALFEGGNFSFGELPNGEKCVFLSKTDFGIYLAHVLCQSGDALCPRGVYDAAKRRYEAALGMPVIVVDEAQYLKDLETKTLFEASRPHPFFHSDMIFFQHRVEDRPTMFVSSLAASLEAMPDFHAPTPDTFLQRVQQQMTELGFEVVEIPFLTNDLNFVNGIAYTDRDTQKPSFLMPSYHFDELDSGTQKGRYLDELAANPYARACFEIAKARYEAAGLAVRSAPYFPGNRGTLRGVMGGNFAFGADVSINGGKKGGFHCRIQLLK